jgi:glutamate carboxypeptidase
MNPRVLYDSCERQLAATLDLLEQMVAINSFTENRTGVNRLGQLTADAFSSLGFRPHFIEPSRSSFGKHLVLQRTISPELPTIALVSHLDTVFTEEEEARNSFRWRRDGSRIYGPGTNDIKGGTVSIHLLLHALREAAPQTLEATNWSILFNSCEEVISTDFEQIARAHLPARTLGCLVFEADGGEGDVFSLVTARKGRATFTFEVAGRGAHAGSEHRRGANAVVELAGIIGQVAALTDYEHELTINPGAFHGGTVANRVPHSARAEIEMRAFDRDIFEDARRRILALNGDGVVASSDGSGARCRVQVLCDGETRPWPGNPGTESLVAHWLQRAKELELCCGTEKRGGLSDGNVIWDIFPTLDGLGPRGENSHCSEQSADGLKVQEWVDAKSFVPKAVLNAMAVDSLLSVAPR